MNEVLEMEGGGGGVAVQALVKVPKRRTCWDSSQRLLGPPAKVKAF